jgi:hypothetical protein
MNGPLAHADARNRRPDTQHPDRPGLRALLPWGVSLAIHAVLVGLALLLIATVVTEPQTEAGVQTAQATPAPDPHQLVYYDTRAALRDLIALPEKDTDETAERRSASREPAKHAPAVRPDTRAVLEADPRTLGQTIAEAKRFADRIALPAAPPRQAAHHAAGDGPFDLSLPAPRDEAQHPRRVVYLIDASGSLVDTFPFIIEQVTDSVSTLPTGSMFTVIFFRNGQVIEQRPLGLKEVTEDTRQAAVAWMQTVHAAGRTSPVPAIERALSYRPDDVILLADNITAGPGGVEGMRQRQARILDMIAQTSRGARVHTIQFLYEDPLAGVPGMEGTLATIARQTDGRHLFVRESDLYPRSAAR